jgi:hypothetical protein
MTNEEVIRIACKLGVLAHATNDEVSLRRARRTAKEAGATTSDWAEAWGKYARDEARFGRTRWSDSSVVNSESLRRSLT